MKIKLVCIATRKYTQFIQPFLESAHKYFFPDDDVNVVIFTDDTEKAVLWQTGPETRRFSTTDIEVPSYGFPEATMLRYSVFADHKLYLQDCDFIFYCDIDSKFVDYVGKDDELATYIREARYSKLFCTRHPGFWNGSTGSWETRRESLSYVDNKDRALFYAAGGFLGGSYNEFINLSSVCGELVGGDLRRGITPVWHDESSLNKYISCVNKNVSFLSPAYVYPEGCDWFNWQGPPRILALKKDHKEIRS